MPTWCLSVFKSVNEGDDYGWKVKVRGRKRREVALAVKPSSWRTTRGAVKGDQREGDVHMHIHTGDQHAQCTYAYIQSTTQCSHAHLHMQLTTGMVCTCTYIHNIHIHLQVTNNLVMVCTCIAHMCIISAQEYENTRAKLPMPTRRQGSQTIWCTRMCIYVSKVTQLMKVLFSVHIHFQVSNWPTYKNPQSIPIVFIAVLSAVERIQMRHVLQTTLNNNR